VPPEFAVAPHGSIGEVLTVLLVSTADTELLAAAASGAGYLTANPQRSSAEAVTGLAARAGLVVLRLLGGRKAWPDGVAALAASGTPLVALGGEASPDAELMALSTVPAGVATEALGYLREGGPENLRELARFLSDTVFLTGEGFEPPRPMPAYGVHQLPGDFSAAAAGAPVVAVAFYRAHELAGNTAFVDTLCAALADQGATPLPVFCGSLRSADSGLTGLLRPAQAVITTVLAAGGAAAADATSEGDWDAGVLAALDVPVLQGLCLTSSRAQWEASNAALAPIDAAMQVAIPEFDGRLITVPFSFKEEGPDGIPRYAADPGRAARLASIAVRHARLARTPNAAKRVAVMLSSYPTKHSRVGNAVGLDTPASAVALLRAMRAAGYDLGDGFPEDGDELIHALIAAGGHDTEWLTEEQLRAAPARVPLAAYRRFFSELPNGVRDSIHSHWGAPPGELYTDESSGDIVLACLRFGNVVLMIQPPRGFGENPVAIYHDPDLPPSHHYLAAYRWLAGEFGADAIVHLGKHGTLEWLPGKGLGLSAECAPDAVLGDLPVVYPFIVNDPGEGTQAKRRAHAVIVDHLVPPMARADTYGEMAKLEQLLDEYATVAALDPDKLPALRAQIWSLIEAAHLHQDLGVEAQPGSSCTSTATCARSRTPRSATACTSSAPPRTARPWSTWSWSSCAPPSCGAPAGAPSPASAPPSATPKAPTPPAATPTITSASRAPSSKPSPPPTGTPLKPQKSLLASSPPTRLPLPPRPRTRWPPGYLLTYPVGPPPPAKPPPPPLQSRKSHASSSSRAPKLCPGCAPPPARSTRCCTHSTAATCPPGRPDRPPGGSSTSFRPAGTSTRSTPRPSRRATPSPPAWPWPTRCWPGTWPTRGSTRAASA
jgi:cobaltochelatase CobN